MGKHSRLKKERQSRPHHELLKVTRYEPALYQLIAFKHLVKDKIEIKTIYYPSCGTDITIHFAFQEARIYFLDCDPKVVEALKRQGYKATIGRVEETQIREKVDLVFMHNPQTTSIAPTDSLRVDGYLVCNNFHGTASILRKQPSRFWPVAVIKVPRANQPPKVLINHPPEIWEECVDDDEFAALYPGYFPLIKAETDEENRRRRIHQLSPLSVLDYQEWRYKYRQLKDWSSFFVFRKVY